MKYLLWVLFLATTGCILLGLSLPDSDTPIHLKASEKEFSEQLIGFGVLGLFFVFMPLFLVYRWKGKQLKDYTLSAENLKKMRETLEPTKTRKKK
jgi:hypothetical protein